MEHKFPLGSLHRENGTTFSEIPFVPEIFQWDEPKNHVPFTTQPEFPEFFDKWKTPKESVYFLQSYHSLSRFFGGFIQWKMSSNDELSSDTSSSCDVESLQLAVEGERLF